MVLKDIHKGWEITYEEWTKKFKAKRNKIVLSHPNLKYLRTRINCFGNIKKKVIVWGYGYKLKKGEATVCEDEYGQDYAWVTYEDGTKLKESSSDLYEDSKHNNKIVEEIKKLKSQRDELEKERETLNNKMENKEKELLPVNWKQKTMEKI